MNNITGLGNFCIQNEIFDKEISGNAKLVYTYLSKCADCFGKSFPSHKNIAGSCSLSVTAVKMAIEELQEEKIVTVTNQYREKGGKTSNLYMIMNKAKTHNFWVMPEIFEQSISAKAKLVYMYFCRCSNEEGLCFPAHRKTSEKCTMALSTCRKAIKELIDATLIAITPRARKDNGQTSNLYAVLSCAWDKVEEVVEKAKDMSETLKKSIFDKGFDTPWSPNSREHSHNIAGGVLYSAYERTKLKLRKYITNKNKRKI